MKSDEELFAEFTSGSKVAFEVLYGRFEGALFGFILRRLQGDRAQAEDVHHEVWLTALRRPAASGTDELRNVRAWLYEVARNLCQNRMRSRRRGDSAMAKLGHVEPDMALAPSDEVLLYEQHAELQEAVLQLPEALQQVYRLRMQGKSYDELALELQVPVGTVKSRIHELVTRLRRELS
jgi:RNA polymerase sigma-70 factor, ECF subfamily